MFHGAINVVGKRRVGAGEFTIGGGA